MSDTQTPATAGWPGYTAEDLAWFAANYADTEWAVHVIGPDDVHTNEPDAQGEHNPDGAPLTEQSAWALADSVRKFNAWYRAKFGEKPAYTEDLIPNVFHRGVLVETRAVAAHEHSFPIQPPHGSLTAPGDCACGAAYTGPPAMLTASGDCEPCQGTGLNIGQPGNCPDCDGTGSRRAPDPVDPEFESESPCEPCDGTGSALPDLATLTMSKPTVRPLDACLIRFQRRGTQIWADFYDADGDQTGTTVHPGDRTVAELIAHYGERGWAVVESAHAADGGAR